MHNFGHGIHRLPHVFSATDCTRFIQQAEGFGFEPATINTETGVRFESDVRNNDRVIFDSADLALEVWRRVALQLPPVWAARGLAGLNERFRFYRYTAAQKFDWHVDGPFERGNGERSQLTLLIYLSDDYEGGETTFDVDGTLTDVRGERGDVVVFPHRLRHRGSVVTAGTKYMLRTDVMYYPLVGAGQSSFPSLDAVRAMVDGP
ncbi:2OG-Fe(II) oxygenase [Roseateles sp. BYS78W]|uniref:2OG-Fe(II) oxygenase n=1 Tax=Pelomonas candidula TaxID=3299025 RepID=A0ABW7HFT1_9BURK